MLLTTAALVAAVVVLVVAALPPRRLMLERSWDDRTVPGLLHVHTNRSDGRSSPDVVAMAAARAGLRFLVFTDHGNGTRETDPPTYRSGVLCLDATEISTTGGHYLALDTPVSPYPLGGEARDVVEDVRRLGGFGVAAHPDSPKSELGWREWTAPLDAIEVINPDTSWRRRLAEAGWRSKAPLVRALFSYPVRSSETIAALLTDPTDSLARWATLTERRRVVALAGVDAHAKLELRNGEPGDNRYSVPIPSYESSFQSLSIRVRLDEPWTGDAAVDARRLMHSLRKGHLYTVVDSWATPPAFEFAGVHAGGRVEAGDEAVATGSMSLQVRSNLPPGFWATIWRGSQPAGPPSRESTVALSIKEPGVYRVEIRADRHPDGPPWIVSNPIYVRRPEPAPSVAPAPRVIEAAPLFDGLSTAGWATESDKTSLAALDVVPRVTGMELRLRYALSGGALTGQYAGAVVETAAGVDRYDWIRFRARAERPMRLSVQVRAESDGVLERWQRSVYLDTEAREHTVHFDDMTPVSPRQTGQLPRSRVRHVMFVVDTTNAKPGSSGRTWLNGVRLEKVDATRTVR
jgi:hypothetical protein